MISVGNRDRLQKPLFVHFLPEAVLFLCVLLFLVVPYIALGSSPLITSPNQTTLTFTLIFTVIQLVAFSFIWNHCKPVQVEEMQFSLKSKATISIGKSLFLCFVCFLTLHVGCVLFGASLLDMVKETALWACMVTTIVTIPNLFLLGSSFQHFYRVVVCGKFENSTERFLYFQSVGPVIGSWASAVVIPLDWERPWQVWPIPCVIGALLGYLMAMLAVSIVQARELKTVKLH